MARFRATASLIGSSPVSSTPDWGSRESAGSARSGFARAVPSMGRRTYKAFLPTMERLGIVDPASAIPRP